MGIVGGPSERAREAPLSGERYGVVRSCPGLPALSVQRRLLQAASCDAILEQGSAYLPEHQRLVGVLLGLRRGDTVIVHSLECLDVTTGELALLLRRFAEAGVTLTIIGGSRAESLPPSDVMPRTLALLADHESRRRARKSVQRTVRAPEAPLTRHQLRFAQDMHRRGHSMRAIGLLFRLPPSEIAKLLRTGRAVDAHEATGADSEDIEAHMRADPRR